MRTGALLAAVSVVALGACQPYLFRQSDRIEVLYPKIYSTVKEPLKVSWRVLDFSAPLDGTFAVFLDRDPMPPGESIDYFGLQDRDDIWVLSQTSLNLGLLATRVGVDPAEQNHHDITVVLLDRTGRRIGEYAGFSEFNVVRGP